MANHPGGRGRQVRVTTAKQPGTPSFTEPEVRRWPHPVEGVEPTEPRRAAGQAELYYIHCALSYQNQLLADIKSLLEKLAADRSAADDSRPPSPSAPSVR